ncbi:hypothetical protein V1J52_20080 [Streptomyces sp. TRM 70351]|uniref:hypothetical protein n=1 Tax=Streptomyces sp. TRM 70351 TaxID=3116552 RepID=UPI002E7BA45C|nr:hypothetical protein [Streptomyces sp. TRM 70351]MEE1930454.1 hypothetical protein [Streptomyces sp. TRM 70351]
MAKNKNRDRQKQQPRGDRQPPRSTEGERTEETARGMADPPSARKPKRLGHN